MAPKLAVENKTDFGKAYTPGLITISKAIEKDLGLKDQLTLGYKLVAAVTDGSAVLRLEILVLPADHTRC